MLVAPLLLFAAPMYADLKPFADEELAARAYEAHIYCLAQLAFERHKDNREPAIIAVEVVEACADKSTTLRAALADVYRRKPHLIAADEDACEAADHYLRGTQARVEAVIREGRKYK